MPAILVVWAVMWMASTLMVAAWEDGKVWPFLRSRLLRFRGKSVADGARRWLDSQG
jgi:hypothetical protein